MKTEITLVDNVLSQTDIDKLAKYGSVEILRDLGHGYFVIEFTSNFEIHTIEDLVQLSKDLAEQLVVGVHNHTLEIEIYNGYIE